MANILKNGRAAYSRSLQPVDKISSASKQGIFLRMFGVLIILCLLYIPIIHSLGDGFIAYPGYLH